VHPSAELETSPRTGAFPRRSYNRQDDCQDRLQCFSLRLTSELGAVIDTYPFGGPVAAMYTFFFYQPPPPPSPPPTCALPGL
jgi:hypothetical protein